MLADSSVVTLGLPAVLREFDADVAGVAWVLTSYNLVLAVTAVPVAVLVRRGGAGRWWRAGLVAFAVASLACALAPGLTVLVAARCLQALGGAAVACAALELLVGRLGARRGVAVWSGAGIAGAALGPALGGALTELLSWQAIFAVQVPLGLAVIVRVGRRVGAADLAAGGSPPAPPGGSPPGSGPRPTPPTAPALGSRFAVGAALALLSAALTAALFLLVVMLIEGWRLSPAAAAAIVSIMPLAALAGLPLGRLLGAGAAAAAIGTVAVGGGLAGLAVLPGAAAGWTVAPQALIGLGLGLALSALTERVLAAARTPVTGAGWTLACRHGGVVIGLLLLTPVFTADLADAEPAARAAGTALLLDANLSPTLKVELGQALSERVAEADGSLPELGPAFRANSPPADQREAYVRLEADLNDELDRAATHAFSRSFAAAAALAALALGLVAFGRAGARGRTEA